MTNSRFPTYGHSMASCMNCTTHLVNVEPKESGYGAGHGQYVKKCRACGMSTWYDIPHQVTHPAIKSIAWQVA